jgi:hypothetical protein
MTPPQNRPAQLWIPAFVLTLALPVGYEAGYFLRTASHLTWPGGVTIRGFHTEWEAKAFIPAAKLEGFCTGRRVHTVGPSGELR